MTNRIVLLLVVLLAGCDPATCANVPEWVYNESERIQVAEFGSDGRVQSVTECVRGDVGWLCEERRND